MKKLHIQKLGPIFNADINFGDLTVLVGPQATGKTLFLQFLMLMQEKGNISYTLKEHGFAFNNEEEFLSLYLGEGMDNVWQKNRSSVSIDNKILNLNTMSQWRGSFEKTFYIPAQRALVFENSWPKPFRAFDPSFPFVVRNFSEKIRIMIDDIYMKNKDTTVFPKSNRFKKDLRNHIQKSIYRNASLEMKKIGNSKKLVLNIDPDSNISLGSWSAGQREFTPLLLGLYWVMPFGKTTRKDRLETVIIEELESGLHPGAILSVMLLLMELLSRSYKVVLSTHSQTVLDVMWGIKELQSFHAKEKDFLKIFGFENAKTKTTLDMAKSCLKKEYSVYYFKPTSDGTEAVDISSLDPGADSQDISGWGGLSEFSGRISDIVGEQFDIVKEQ